MNQYTRMISEQSYDPSDTLLRELRQAARKHTHAYNNTINHEEHTTILHELFGSVKGKVKIEPPFYCDYGSNIHVGDNFYANFGFTALDCAPITIGDNCLFGPHVSLYTPTHPLHPELRNSGLEKAKRITIGNNVWLGGQVVINPGVTIGDNTVIGSGSVVTKDIPAHCIAVGNPCKVLRAITDEDKNTWE